MPYVSFKEEATLEVGKERLCAEVEVSARCRNGPTNSFPCEAAHCTLWHSCLQLVLELAGVV